MTKKHKMLRAKLIANPGAGKKEKLNTRLEQVVRYLGERGIVVDVALVHPKRKAIPIVAKAVKSGYDMVISMGGDGTLGAVIRGLAGTKMKLGILPAGTENDVAASLGIPDDLEQACDVIVTGNVRKIDLPLITTGRVKKYPFPMVATVGLIATIYPMVADVPFGKLEGIPQAVKSLVTFENKPKVQLSLDGESDIEVETMLVTIANTPLIGAHQLVAPDALLDDGLLDIAVYPEFTKAEVLGYFLQIANQGFIPDGRIQRFRARKIKIKTNPKLDIAVEGIVMGKGRASIKLLRRALRVFAPKPGQGAEKPPEQAAVDLPAPASPVANPPAL